MANVVLKSDFRDGDLLFAQQLNNNFKAIQKALETMNGVIWQDNAEMVVTFRGTTEEINERDIIDGQILYDVLTGETYIDYDGERISTGSGNAIHIGENEPTNPSTQVWIESDEVGNMLSEVVNNLDGNETNKAPSVAAVNNCNKYSTEETFTGKYWLNGKKIYRKTFYFSELTNSSDNILGKIDNINYIVSYDGTVNLGGNMYVLPLIDYSELKWSIGIVCNIASGDVIIKKGGYGTVTDASHLTIEYTKTTDTVEESEVVSNEV